MTSHPPSQAFLDAPDDFVRPLPRDDGSANNKSQSSTTTQAYSSQIYDRSAQVISRNEPSSSNRPESDAQANSDLNHEQQLQNDPITPTPSQKASSSSSAHNQNANADMDYEMHYGLSQHSVKDVVREILDDITARRNLYNWDEKLIQAPFKRLENVIRNHLATCSQEMLNNLLNQSSVEEVANAGGKLESTPAMQHGGEVHSLLFFSKEQNT